MDKTKFLLLLLMSACLAFLSSCSKNRVSGAAIPQDAQRVTMKEVLENPDSYDGKELVMEGIFLQRCCEADFLFASGKDSLEVIVSDECPMPGKSYEKSKLLVYGIAREKDGTVTIEARGMEFQ